MAAKKRGGHRQTVKGFRPGKEPTHLKKQRAKAQLGKDASWAQKQTVDAIAGRSPEEVRQIVQRWSIGLFTGALLLAIVGFFLYGWSGLAGGVVHVISGVLFFLGYRVRKQSSALVEMADSL